MDASDQSSHNQSQRRLPPLLRRAWYGLNQSFRQQIAHSGITPDQYSVLRWLAEAQPVGMTQIEITDRMASDPNTIAAVVRRMEQAGLIRRSQHKRDRRARLVQIEPSGLEMFRKLQPIAEALQAKILSCLSSEEAAQFLQTLEKISDACFLQESDIDTGNPSH